MVPKFPSEFFHQAILLILANEPLVLVSIYYIQGAFFELSVRDPAWMVLHARSTRNCHPSCSPPRRFPPNCLPSCFVNNFARSERRA
jgi:hypothetical protein